MARREESYGRAATIHAARARRLKSQLDRIDELLEAGGFADGGTTAKRVEDMCAELVRLRRELEDRKWDEAAQEI